MKTFKDIEFKEHPFGGIIAKMKFDNGYGISVIKAPFSYGGENGLYECAVILDGQLCYDTPVADDVIGYCDEKKVTDVMREIQELPSVICRFS